MNEADCFLYISVKTMQIIKIEVSNALPKSIEGRPPRQPGYGGRVLIVINSHGLIPPEGDTFSHLLRITQPPPLLYSEEKREPAYLSGGFSSTYS
ncbi:hypothetical protein AVEN_58401-1 [Araneus ventricosus]|uniref:Uncharacterized protein n=1 Tax=Araneus ventricosus TaxID=182803 RepID=A0A4Y2F5U3_ARAVE|nr:hypothetical protein AVEN_58401-1 [Araneus ventricosus]